MADLTESSNWEANVPQIETTDPVIGGENGPANVQSRALANRTQFLKDAIGGLGGDVAEITNLDTLQKTGFFAVTSDALSHPQAGISAFVHHIQSAGGAGQVVATVAGRLYFRANNGVNWTAWREAYYDGRDSDLTIGGDLYVGRDGQGDSKILFWDDNSNAWRSLFWDDSQNGLVAEGNDGIKRRLATLTDLENAVEDLLGSAPGALNTLNELAEALGDNPNFAADITNQLAGKLGKTEKAADADKLDGLGSSQFLRSDIDSGMKGRLRLEESDDLQLQVGINTGGARDTYVAFYNGETTRRGFIQFADNRARFHRDGGAVIDLYGPNDARLNNNQILHAGNNSTIAAPEMRRTGGRTDGVPVDSVSLAATGRVLFGLARNASGQVYGMQSCILQIKRRDGVWVSLA